MTHFKRSRIAGVVGAALLCAAWSAHAQDSNVNSSAGNSSAGSGGVVIGPPALKDFQLTPDGRTPVQPRPQPQPPVQNPQVPAAETPRNVPTPAPRTERPMAQPEATRPAQPEPEVSAPAPVGEPITAEPGPAPAFEAPATDPAPEAAEPVAAEPQGEGISWWLYAIPIAALALLGFVWLRRRRKAGEAAEEAAAAAHPAVAPTPRREPVPRPWLELELKAERASFTETEWVVNFQLVIANTSNSAARNLRIDVKLFNAGKEQDKEIGAFFRTAGRDTTKLKLPGIPAGQSGMINGEVAIPLAEMRALKVSDRSLFIPVVAVNALYDWGEGRTGQTAKSYLVGRELQEPSDKMGAFRVDRGPRIWRTVGQRQHKLARRV